MATKSPSRDLVVAGEVQPSLAPPEQRVLFLIQEFASAWKRTLDVSIELGEALTDLKAALPHGQFGPWIEQHAPFTERHARRFMELAANRTFMSDLPSETTVTAATKWLQAQRRTPRPLPEQDGIGLILDDPEATREPLLRFSPPGTPTHVIIDRMLLTFFPDASTALDTTYGSGNFWSQTTHVSVTGHDLDEYCAPDGVMDCTDLKYDDASFDVVLFDPPHIADGGEDGVMATRFSTVATQAALDELILQGTREAWRVCDKGIIVKVTNHVHGRLFQNEVDLVAEALGWNTPLYDQVHQVRDHAFIDPSWGEQMSAYNNGSTLLVYRKGSQIHGRRD
jgi:Protein of unknown function (DUF3102)